MSRSPRDLFSKTSIRAHLVQASTNDRSRLHHPATNSSDDLLFKVSSGQFRLNAAEEEVGDEAQPGSSEFLLERDLQRYSAENLECIEPGLKLYEDESIKGFEFEAGGGRRIDILGAPECELHGVSSLKVLQMPTTAGRRTGRAECRGA
jgi:hypothetical protein